MSLQDWNGGRCRYVIMLHVEYWTLILVCAGLGLGAFFSLMSASFAYEDPILRPQAQTNVGTTQKAREIFKDMGKGMWRSGKGFGKVGALFAGLECAIEAVCFSSLVCIMIEALIVHTSQYRAKNDMVNPVVAGFIAGGILARNSGPKAAVGGGAAFAAFSAAIDLFLKRETSEYVVYCIQMLLKLIC